MKFWDASAIVPLLVAEPTTRGAQALARRDPDMLVWWGCEVECVSALARLERSRALEASSLALASDRLNQLAEGWHEVEANDLVRENAIRFLRVHALRGADSLQLAAAFVAAGGRPSLLDFVTLDEQLAAAARKEGFVLVDIPAG